MSIRYLLLAAALLAAPLTSPATAQNAASSKEDIPRLKVRAAERLPVDAEERAPLVLGEASADVGEPSDSLTEVQILRRMGRLYRLQSDIMLAQAEGDDTRIDDQFELAMTELSTLADQANVMERSRFRELYRSLVTEYEKYYGVEADSLTLQFGDIFQFRADIFAALDNLDQPLLEDVMRPELKDLEFAETTIPMTMNRLVEQSITYLTRNPDNHLYHWLSRAETYFPMIEQILAEEGVPDELKYLAMIESGLNPRARSWAKAAGMWQFIAPTGRAYGLQVNAWVDERLDPEKATRAAARHLKDLHTMFGGDWQLALAGYNCNPARIRRALRRAEAQLGRKATFWDIYHDIPRETRGYVPMFIAASLVASNPDALDLNPVKAGPRYEYDVVPVQGMLSLDDVAEMAGTSVTTIRALNPELRRSMLPPTNEPYYVRIPVSTAGRFAEAYAELPDHKKRPVSEHVVRRGDALGKIARQYGVSLSALKSANGLRSNTIHPGQRLVVPVARYDASAPLPQLASGETTSVRYGARAVRPIQAPTSINVAPTTPVARASSTTSAPAKPKAKKASTPTSNSETRVVYTVRRGDALGKIAQKYKVSVRDIQTWNKLRGTRIQAGQRLYLYTSGPSQPERVVYKVRRGDNLTLIGKKYGVSVSSLRSWNKLKGSKIVPGQRLTIYPGGSADSGPKVVTHRVQRGDNLTKIAKKYGVSVSNLRKWNNLKGSKIVPGQRLKIYT